MAKIPAEGQTPPPTGDYFHYCEDHRIMPAFTIGRSLTKTTSEVFIGANGLIIQHTDGISPPLFIGPELTMKIVDAIARYTMAPENPALFNYIKQLNAQMKDTTDERK